MPFRYGPKKSQEEVLASLFITRREFNALVGLPPASRKRLYERIKEDIEKELGEIELPDVFHLPTGLVIKRLRKFGFSEKRLLGFTKKGNEANEEETDR